MNENELSIVQYGEQNVVTSRQIAEAYGTTSKIITKNFNRNKAKFQEGKHYFKIEGDELNEFRRRQNDVCKISSQTRHLYLWTEKGALLLAKSINTDVAWEAYERLVDFYFEKKEASNNDDVIVNAISKMADGFIEVTRNIALLNNRIENIETGLKLESNELHTCPTLTWYERNKDTIYYVAEQRGITGKKVISMVLSHVGEYYDLTKAKEIYYKQTGSKPLYDLDIIDYFSNLQKEATGYLNSLIRKKPVEYDDFDIADMF